MILPDNATEHCMFYIDIFVSCRYGQTGSGKTFTMLGDSESADSLDESRGLIQRIFEHLFMRIREKQEQVNVSEGM
jgi:hypothetical protein